MRYGFFHGIEGDLPALREVFDLLSDCERIVSLGDLVRRPGPGDAGCLSMVLPAAGGVGRVLLLAGPGERERARDLTLPPEVRLMLRGLVPATVERGVAILGSAGGDARSPEEARILGDRPRLVAPITVAAGKPGSRLWRAVGGGLDNLGPLSGPVALPRGAERLRLELGSSVDEGILRCAVLDLEARTLDLRERLCFQHAARGRTRSAG